MRLAFGAGVVALDADVAPGVDRVPVRLRAELGERPAIEVIYLLGHIASTVDTYSLLRGQESTAAADWPVGTPMAFTLADSEPAGEFTVNLARPLAADARQIDLIHAYRRLKLDSEIVWNRSLLPDRVGIAGSERAGYAYRTERGMEGTAEVAHDVGAAVVFLAPGEE